MAGIVVLFDFDKTIIDLDSDNWVVNELGVTDLFNQLLPTMPWNSVMILSAIWHIPRGLVNFGHRSLQLFVIDLVAWRLRIFPFHDFQSSSHGCNLCPPNMCKGMIIERIQASLAEEGKKTMIYLGDGSGDFCPSLKLKEGDYVMPRKNFPVWDLICQNHELVRAKIHEWSDGEELERVLLKLIETISTQESHSNAFVISLLQDGDNSNGRSRGLAFIPSSYPIAYCPVSTVSQ